MDDLKALETLIGVLKESAQWWGAAFETMPSADAVIRSSRELSNDEIIDALEFYDGQQWPQDVLAHRCGHVVDGVSVPPRPCLVVNRLTKLVALAIDRNAGVKLSMRDMRILKAIITRQNRDAQMLYNYTLSSLVELESKRATF